MPLVDIEETTWMALFLAPALSKDIDKIEVILSRSLNRCWNILNLSERSVLHANFGLDGHLPRTLDEICASMGMERRQVQSIRKRGLLKLYAYLRDGHWPFSLN